MITFAVAFIAAAAAVAVVIGNRRAATESDQFAARVAKARYQRAKALALHYRQMGHLGGEVRAVSEMQYWHRGA